VKILLTGRDGQVGFELAKVLEGNVAATDRAALDLFYPDLIRRTVRQERPELIINAAAYTAVEQAESEPDVAMEVNGVAPGVLAEEAKRLGALLVHYSTDYVFDGEKPAPYIESDATNPLNVYGRTKLEGEKRIAAAGCRHLILRTSWVYGPRGRNFLLTVLKAGKNLKVVNDQLGAPTSSVAIARATLLCLKSKLEGLYHLSAAGNTSWHGFAEAILGRPVTAVSSAEYKAKARRPRNSVLDNGKLNRAGVALADWRDGLKEVLAAARNAAT
jgi:dTDP-4-dehydrorhamnose reductase